MKKSATSAQRGVAARIWHGFPLKTHSRALNLLLLASPLAIVFQYLVHSPPLLTFAVSALAIVPLAATLGDATEDLAEHTGARTGALLNATLGNLTELIIGILMVRAGHLDIVKASLSGSIIGNTLLVFGMSALFGGFGREKQTFSRSTATTNSTTLFVAMAALILPAIYSISVFGRLRSGGGDLAQISLYTSLVLIVLYALNLVLQFSHPRQTTEPRIERSEVRSLKSALIALGTATVVLAIVSEILVGTVEQSREALGLSPVFMGVVVIAVIGNAAEHFSAITFARHDKMDLALGITVGSSVQIALLVAPLLVLVSRLFGHPMSLVFTTLEIGGITLAVITTAMISFDGESNWFEGAQLIAVYLIFAIATFFMPAPGAPAH